MQNPYITERLAAENRRQSLQEARTRGSYFQTGSSHIAKQVVMKHIHLVRRTAGVVLAICSGLLSFVLFAPSAFALMVNFPTYANGRGPAPTGARPSVSQSGLTAVHTVVTSGMAGWLITVIAVGAALLAATVAVFMDRARAAHRRLTAPAT